MLLRTFVKFCFTKKMEVYYYQRLASVSTLKFTSVYLKLRKVSVKDQPISANHSLADVSSFLLGYCCCSLFSVSPQECSARFRHTKNSPYPNHSLDSLTAVKYILFFPTSMLQHMLLPKGDKSFLWITLLLGFCWDGWVLLNCVLKITVAYKPVHSLMCLLSGFSRILNVVDRAKVVEINTFACCHCSSSSTVQLVVSPFSSLSV